MTPAASRHELSIDGTATMVGRWQCGGDAKVEVTAGQIPRPDRGFAPGMQTVVVTTSVPEIDCGDSNINKHMRKALKDKEYPEVRYVALHYALVDNGAAVQTSGELTVAGVTRPVGLGAKLIPLAEGAVQVVGTVEINMRDYGIKPPSLFFGVLRVADKVNVSFNTVVQLPTELTKELFAGGFRPRK